MNLPIVILAGGLATRLKPLTEKIPKAVVKVAGLPFIFWQLQLLKKQNFKNVIISTGYLGEKIKSLVGNGNKFGLKISYENDGEKLLGTGGALKKMLDKLPEYFFVMYGDTFLPINFKIIENKFLKIKKKNLMVVLKNNNKWANSNVSYENHQIISYSNKSQNKDLSYIDYGLSILCKKSFLDIEEKTFGLEKIFLKLISQNKLFGHKTNKRFYEINTVSSLKVTEVFLEKNKKNLFTT